MSRFIWMAVSALLAALLIWELSTGPEIETVVERDTTTVVERDTVYERVERTEVEVVRDTVYVEDEQWFEGTLPTRRYVRRVDDGMISGTITSQTRGWLLDQSFTYSAQVPIETVVRTQTIYERETRTVRDSFVLLGMEGGGNRGRLNNFGAIIGYHTGDLTFHLRYNAIQGTYNVGISYRLF